MARQDVKQFIKRLNDLSTLPVLLGKIQSVVNDETKSTEDLGHLIGYDQAMSQRVLKVANSAFFAHSGQIRDIQQAVLFLGMDRIKNIAIGTSVMQIFPSRDSFKIENLWIHGYEVALVASLLSESVNVTQPPECFLAGLLHDIGRLVFYTMDHDLFARIDTSDTMLEQEMTLFGCTHAEAGAWLAQEMKLPSSVVNTIRFHHAPSAATEERNIVSLVSLAEVFTRMFRPRLEDDGIWTPEHNAILLELSLTPEEQTALGDKFMASQKEIESIFS